MSRQAVKSAKVASTVRQNVVRPRGSSPGATVGDAIPSTTSTPPPAASPVPARSRTTSGMAITSPTSPTSPASAPDGKMSRSASAKNAINARWAGEEAAELEIHDHFVNLPTDDAIHLLNRMRTNCEIAAKAINEAIEKNKKEDRCYVCTGPKPPNKQWAFVKAVKQPVTNIMVNIFFCSTACVSRENIKNQGAAGANHLR